MENFTISFNPQKVGNSVTISRFNDMYCNGVTKQCSYTHVLPSNLSVSHFEMQVTASNIVGRGRTFLLNISEYI